MCCKRKEEQRIDQRVKANCTKPPLNRRRAYPLGVNIFFDKKIEKMLTLPMGFIRFVIERSCFNRFCLGRASPLRLAAFENFCSFQGLPFFSFKE